MKYYYTYDPRREVLWKEIARYIQKDIGTIGTVLELGAGYCHFINNILASNKYALDSAAEPMKYAGRDITAVICPCWDLSRFETSSIDFVFASNLLEHLTPQQAHETLSEVNRVLKPRGIFGVVGPNYYYCSRIYWDDFTHRLALSHRSLASMLEYSGFKIIKLKKKFLPFSIRSTRLPIKAWMVRAYLISPLKPFGRQMYLLSEKE